jgi:preprotein translocase subunit SecE
VRIIDFVKEVKSEVLRIAWPSRKETMMAVGLVFLMTAVAGLFFVVVDALIYRVIKFILGMGF